MGNNYFTKFIFLIVVIGAVLFSRLAYPTAGGVGFNRPQGLADAASSTPVPMFAIPSGAVSANGGSSATTTDSPAVSVSSLGPPPALTDFSSLVANLQNGQIFESVNADSRWPTASLTKLMTATVVEDKLAPSTTITITETMLAVDPGDETTLVLGGTYTVADILRAMLLPSSNVAAEALADFYGRTAFLAEMNARAAAWGMTNTYFDDPSGLSAANQSTASDFMKLAQKIYTSYPGIFAITRTPQVTITEENSNKKVLVKSINNFAGEPNFIGGKTGHTPQAAGNLLSVFKNGSQPVLIVVLGTDERFNDTQKLYDWIKA